PASGDGNPWDALARGAWGAGWVLVFLAVANSAIANANASANAATRTWFAMGRIRLLPRPLEHVNPRWRSPDVAVTVQFVVGVVVSLWLGLQYDPLTAFAIVGTIVTAVIIAIYMVVNLACLVFYLREGRAEFNPVLHGLVPVLGIAAFLPAFLTGVGIEAFDFVSALPYPISLVGPVVGIWYAIGLVYLVVLMRRGPDRVGRRGRGVTGGAHRGARGPALPPGGRDGGAQLPAGPGGVRLDLRRGAAGPPGPAGQRAGAVDRGRLRGAGQGTGRPGLPGGRVPLRQPPDRAVLRRGGRARGHPGHPLRSHRAAAGLGRLAHHPAVRGPHRHPRHRPAPGAAGRGGVDVRGRPGPADGDLQGPAWRPGRDPAAGPDARHRRGRAGFVRGPLVAGSRRPRRQHGHPRDAGRRHLLPGRERRRGAVLDRRRPLPPGGGGELRGGGRGGHGHGRGRRPGQRGGHALAEAGERQPPDEHRLGPSPRGRLPDLPGRLGPVARGGLGPRPARRLPAAHP